VAWKSLEQDEPGDTLIHTFTWLDWPICLTRWFTHRGQVAGEWSPSCGPYFKRHRPQPLRDFLTPLYDGSPLNLYWNPYEPPLEHWEYVRFQDTHWDPGVGVWGDYVGKYIWKGWYPPGVVYDFYIFHNLSTITAWITCLTLHALVGRTTYPYGNFLISIQLNGDQLDTWTPVPGIPLSWRSVTFTANPFTGKPWTVSEVNALHAGIGIAGTGSYGKVVCDQFYIEVLSCHMREY